MNLQKCFLIVYFYILDRAKVTLEQFSWTILQTTNLRMWIQLRDLSWVKIHLFMKNASKAYKHFILQYISYQDNS